MNIQWYGEGCFKIQTGEAVLLTDVFEASSGLTPPKVKADISLRTLTPIPFPDFFASAKTDITGGGEYEIKGVEIRAFQLVNESTAEFVKTIFKVKADDLSLVFLGHISEMPAADVLEQLGEVDILFMPVPQEHFLPADKALTLVRQLNPKVLILSFFKAPGLKRKAVDPQEFASEFGGAVPAPEKLVLKKKELPAKLQVYVPNL